MARDVRVTKEAQLTNNGQMSVMLQWLQSIDQRFMALMAPVTPPRVGGASR
jgi:hypothetical protein